MKGGTPKPRTDRSPSISFLPEHDRESFQNHLPEKTFTAYEQLHGPQPVDMRIVIVFAILSILIRVYYIKNPAEIVFDEMHFGGFASKYITARFFFDVHPPLGKLIVAFSGVFSGYDGSFSFEKIGQSYIEGNVPYIAMRVVPALFGSAIVPVGYATMRNFGFSSAASVLCGVMLIFENAMVGLILLDAFLVFFTTLTALMWSEFLRYKNEPFSVKWWRSLTLVGVALGLTVSVKWVGLFTITLIGVFTIGQLWSIITDGAIPLRTFQKHFMARVVTLIMIPCMIYLTCFRIHFAILNKTGPGSSFMSPEFQSGLGGSFAKESYLNVAYGSTVVLLHEGTRGGFLHSHPHNYPGGSKQQQITCYPHRDKNSDFLLKYPLNLGDLRNITEKPIVEFEKILHKQTIRLEHLATNLRLHSHDVRPTFTDDKEVNEVTAYGSKTVLGDANDHWVVEIEGGDSTTELHALNSKFRLRHLNTGCYLMSRTSKLPDWAFGQQEVTCSTKGRRDLTIWRVDSVSHPNMPEGSPRVSYTKPGFFKSFVQLHKLMWTSNKGLKGSHPYDSRPTEWPFMHRGIGFWRSTPDTKGIYLLGNPVVWLSATFAVLLYLGFIVVELVLEQRKISFQKSGYYKEMLLGIWFFAIGYLLHFLPFFLMGGQLFLHHYLPSLYFGILVFCGMFDFVTFRMKKMQWVLVAGIAFVVIYVYYLFSPLTYGVEQSEASCNALKWRSSWDFNCPSAE